VVLTSYEMVKTNQPANKCRLRFEITNILYVVFQLQPKLQGKYLETLDCPGFSDISYTYTHKFSLTGYNSKHISSEEKVGYMRIFQLAIMLKEF